MQHEKEKRKERHPVYRTVIAGCIFLLLMGVLILVAGLVLGDSRIIQSPPRML